MTKQSNIILFGPGLIGQTLIEVLINAIERYRSPLNIIGVVDRSGGIIAPEGFASSQLRSIMSEKQSGIPLAANENALSHTGIARFFSPETIIVDTTDSETLYPILLEGLKQGSRLTMSNKRNLVLPWKIAESFFDTPKVRFESTVCSGTPVINNIQNLLSSLDEIHAIEGCLSGTLNYICSQLDNSIPMSRAIEDAHDFGYTEPDPREDLRGLDVARKALILGRMVGWRLEMEDISVEQLYPSEMEQFSRDEFFDNLSMLSPKYHQLARHAEAEGMSLRYIASVDAKGGRCYMKAVAKDSEFGLLKGTANKVSILSRIHNPIPLTISGSGAGAEVTAAGLLSDILALAKAGVN